LPIGVQGVKRVDLDLEEAEVSTGADVGQGHDTDQVDPEVSLLLVLLTVVLPGFVDVKFIPAQVKGDLE